LRPRQTAGCEFDLRRDIEFQRATGDRLGSVRDPLVARYNQGNNDLMAALRGSPQRLALFTAMTTVTQEQRFYEIREHELNLERQRIEAQVNEMETRLGANRNEQRINREQFQANTQQIEQLRSQLAHIDEQFIELSARSGAARETVERISTFSERFQRAISNGSISPEERASLAQGLPPSIATELLNAYEGLQNARRDQQRLTEIQDTLRDRLANLPDRHTQLRNTHIKGKGWLEEEMARHPNWTVGLLQAQAYANTMSFLGKDSALLQAWRNVIKLNGQTVYRENETGRFYTLGNNNQQQFITDINTLSTVIDQYSRGQMVGNESIYGSSSYDTFDETADTQHARSAMEDSGALARRRVEANAAFAIAERRVQNLEAAAGVVRSSPSTSITDFISVAAPPALAQTNNGNTDPWAHSHISTFLSVAANPGQVDSPNTGGPAVIPTTRH
jgi:hypothetical protein